MRYPSIDVLRTLAIAVMVVVHFVENLSAWHGSPGSGDLPVTGFSRPTGFAAPLFTFLVGVSYRLWVRGREARGDSDDAITKSSVRRGLFLLGLGFGFNVLVWLPEDVFNWDVLTFIGSALLLLAACRNATPGMHLVMVAAAVAVSPALRDAAGYQAYWTQGWYEPDPTLGDVALGFLCTGYFPVFPWIAYPLAGYAAAPAVFPTDGRPAASWPPRLGAGLAGVAVCSVLARHVRPSPPDWLRLQGWTMFPASTEYVCGTLGMALIVLPLAHRLLDRRRDSPLAPLARTFSRHALSIYILHHLVHVWPLWVWGAWTSDDVTTHWQRAMPAPASLTLAAGFLVAAWALFRWMDATGRRGIEGWMRWLCD
ncbi:MAG: heparan-alpha-glucosaminide N-acetyltransferase domain-containing protein [Planctomycetaceae bacterium]